MSDLIIKPNKADKLANQLYEQILDWIISGMLTEGDKLPSENELCKSFQVSRPIVREAMLKLQNDALVNTKKGIGTFVLHSPLKDLSKFASANMESVPDWDSLAQLRLIMEVETEFGLDIPVDEIPSLQSYAEILIRVESALAKETNPVE